MFINVVDDPYSRNRNSPNLTQSQFELPSFGEYMAKTSSKP